jgi:hypothetical protein
LSVQVHAALTNLRTEIEGIAARYLGLKYSFDQAPKVAERRAALGEIHDVAGALLDCLENLDDDTSIALGLAASGSELGSMEAKLGASGGREAYLVGEEEIEAATQYVYNLQTAALTAFNLLPEPKRGRPPVIAFTAFVWMLARLYEAETGRRATVTYNSIAQSYGGSFLDLVEICARQVMQIQSTNALGKRVQRALKARPKLGG